MTETATKNENALTDKPLMERLVSLCKRRGFIFQASEIYGGINGFWDYGPLGTALKNNIRDRWWKDMVECPPDGPDGKPVDIVGLDSAIIQHPTTWVASGHTSSFNDDMVDCRVTKLRYRADHMLCVPVDVEKNGTVVRLGVFGIIGGEEDAAAKLERKAKKLAAKKGGGTLIIPSLKDQRNYMQLNEAERTEVIGPDVEEAGTLTEPRKFNMLFETYVGTSRSDDAKAYLRGETAQGIFLNFKNVVDTSRVKVPFGIAQIGKAFRNEVTPRNFIFRSREFEQMEMEFFVPPEDGMMWHEYWVAQRLNWWKAIGLSGNKTRRYDFPAEELIFYAKACTDVEYQFPFSGDGYGELESIAYRTDYDLMQHQTHSRQKLDFFDAEANRRYVPHVVEPASGLTRTVLAVLCEAYQVDESRASPEWLKIHPSLAPVKLGIFPLVNKDGMPEMAEKIHKELRRDFTCQFDAKQSIGKRYARMDECGTPFCITVDSDSLTGNDVTVRNRDTATQERVSADKLKEYLKEKFAE